MGKNDMMPSDSSEVGTVLYMPSVSVDCVTLGFHSGCLKVLLRKFEENGRWMLPGSLVAIDEDVDKTAQRALSKRTGVKNAYLKQFYLFGRKNRTNKDENAHLLRKLNIEEDKAPSYLQRFMSLSYYALVRFDQVKPTKPKAGQVEVLDWFALDSLPGLYGDHQSIIQKAVDTIRMQVGYVPLGYRLLPEKFTMPELRIIYETILEREIDRRNFQRKILSTGLIIPLNETRKIGPHKSPILYSFDIKKYGNIEKNLLQFMSNNF